MRRWLTKLLIILCCCVSLTALAGQRYPFKSEQKAQEFNSLSHQLRCLVCQNESLASSQAALAIQLRDEVYHMVQAGESSPDIKAFMVQRYGDFVLFKPPVVTRTLLLWYGPFALLFLGVLVLFFIVKQRRSAQDAVDLGLLSTGDEQAINDILHSGDQKQ